MPMMHLRLNKIPATFSENLFVKYQGFACNNISRNHLLEVRFSENSIFFSEWTKKIHFLLLIVHHFRSNSSGATLTVSQTPSVLLQLLLFCHKFIPK